MKLRDFWVRGGDPLKEEGEEVKPSCDSVGKGGGDDFGDDVVELRERK